MYRQPWLGARAGSPRSIRMRVRGGQCQFRVRAFYRTRTRATLALQRCTAWRLAMRLGGGKMACSPPPPSLPLLLLLGIGSAVAQSGYDIKEFDTDESGALEPKEFARFLQSTPAKGQPKGEIRSMFKQINTSKYLDCDQSVCVDACAIVLTSATPVDNDNGVDQSEFDEFLNQMAKDKPPPPPPPPKQKSAKKDKAFTSLQKRQIKSLQDFYKKHGATVVAPVLAAGFASTYLTSMLCCACFPMPFCAVSCCATPCR